MINNNEFSKCHFHENPEHYSLLNTPHLMNYLWGKLDNFKERVSTGTVINGCDNQIMHGKFNHGKKPRASLFEYNGRIQALITNEQVMYDDLSIVSRFLCGGAEQNLEINVTSSANSIIQSFSLTDYKIFNLLDEKFKK